MAEQQTELGNWVDQLITTIFFQPDDEVSKKAMQNGFSPDLKIWYVLSWRTFEHSLTCAKHQRKPYTSGRV